MMASWICASLKKPDQNLLDPKKRLFQYKQSVKKTIEEDGPLVLKIIYDRINPSTRVSVRNLISKIFQFNLKDYNQDVLKMADEFEATYNLILDKEDETVIPEAPFFDALLTSLMKISTLVSKLNLPNGKVVNRFLLTLSRQMQLLNTTTFVKGLRRTKKILKEHLKSILHRLL